MNPLPPELRAQTLIEALPHIQQFRGSTVVIKYGGSAMEDPALVDVVLRDIVLIDTLGIDAVIVHGGGKAITQRLKESGIPTQFIAGQRVTDAESVKVVQDVLDNEVNAGIVRQLESHRAWAKGLRGIDVFTAVKQTPTTLPDGTVVDLGFVGDITSVRDAEIRDCVAHQVIPVISPLGRGEDGTIYNVNADLAARQVAISLKALKLIYLSDVPGVLRDPKDETSIIPTIRGSEVDSLRAEGVLTGGILPKIHSALEALQNGVQKVQFVDGRKPHSLLLELFTDAGIGTEIIA